MLNMALQCEYGQIDKFLRLITVLLYIRVVNEYFKLDTVIIG